MKNTVKVAALLSLVLSGAGMASVNITGSISDPKDASGVSLGDKSFAALIVDSAGDGIEFTSSLGLTQGGFYGLDNYVASIFATVDFFGSNTANGSGTFDLAGDLQADDAYYIVWFDDTAGTADNSATTFEVTPGQAYGYNRAADWVVPSDGGTATPGSASGSAPEATRAVVIPEPSVALLGALGLLGLVRRRR